MTRAEGDTNLRDVDVYRARMPTWRARPRRHAVRSLSLIVMAGMFVCLFAPAASARPSRAVHRVLVFSVPDMTWAEMKSAPMPNLRAFLEHAAVGSLAPARTVNNHPGPADAYMTFAAGTRAVGSPTSDGDQLERDELVNGVPAPQVFQQRTGTKPTGAILSIGYPVLQRLDATLPYDTKVGAVPQQLVRNHVSLAVIANADGVDGFDQPDRHREAALALTTPDGQLEGGTVGDELLQRDASAPYGVRLDQNAVDGAFTKVWDAPGDQRRLVLVEASDLARTRRYAAFTTGAQSRALRDKALRDSDALFASLLAHVDLTRDAVLVVGAPSAASSRTLNLVALRAPGEDSGYVRSASSQHAGVVIMYDVGPTMLDLFGINFTEAMEGRPFEVVASHASLASREHKLIDEALGSRLRSQRLVPITMLLVVLLAIAVLATVLVVLDTSGTGRRFRHVVAWFSLFVVAMFPATMIAEITPGHLGSMSQYQLLLVLLSAGIATLVSFVPRKPFGPVVALMVIVLGVVMIDAMTGSHMHYNAVFGYSPTSNSRLYGISNYSFGAVVPSALLLAAAALAFLRGRVAWIVAGGLLCYVIAVEGVPAWGSDVGGVLAAVPTFLVFVVLARQGKLRVRTILYALGATAAAIALFSAADLLRPADQRAHLGRLVERVSGGGGAAPLTAIVGRKFLAALNESTRSFWVTAIPIGIALIVVLSRLGDKPLARLHKQMPTLGIALVSIYLGAFLGSALNDSGAIVAGITFFTLSGSLCYLALEHT